MNDDDDDDDNNNNNSWGFMPVHTFHHLKSLRHKLKD
jgi:hypothetical protein